MPHVLAKIKGVKLADLETVLKVDANKHAEKGLYLEHIWQNTDDSQEVIFLFKADDLEIAREYINSEHTTALKQDANANLPEMTYLK